MTGRNQVIEFFMKKGNLTYAQAAHMFYCLNSLRLKAENK